MKTAGEDHRDTGNQNRTRRNEDKDGEARARIVHSPNGARPIKKSGRDREEGCFSADYQVAISRKRIILFHCPLDGERFNDVAGFFACEPE